MSTFNNSKTEVTNVAATVVNCTGGTLLRVYKNVNVVISGSSNTMTAAQILGGVYQRGTTGTLSDTLPSAASIVSQMNTEFGSVAVGDSVDLYIRRTTGATTDFLVFSAGTGVTIYGLNAIAGSRSYPAQVVVTNVGSGTEAVSFFLVQGSDT
jgi:hypothetical protein